MKRLVIAVLVLAVAGAGLAQNLSTFRDAERAPVTIGEVSKSLVESVPMTRGKICSVFVPNHWRDSLSVADHWGVTSCKEYMAKMGGVWYQLGCMHPAGAIFGDVNGGAPSPNSGW